MRLNAVFISLMVLGLTACGHYQKASVPMSAVADKPKVSCEIDLSSDDWIGAFLLSPELREEALSTVEAPENIQQISLRAFLLTHSDASYRDLREAEDLILNQLPLSGDGGNGCQSDELIDYILKLNQTLQKRKSAVVLLQRQVGEQRKTIEIQSAENAELEKKIEALTNIEHRMKTRSVNVEPEVTP